MENTGNCGKPYDCFFGLPRSRIVHSSPNRSAVSVTQLGSPKGQPRLTQHRNASTSASVCGWLTSCSQSVGRGKGHAERMGNAVSSRCTHTAQTRPAPRFRLLHEVCTQGVPLHVANDLVEVVFCFHLETLVTPLIEMAVPDLVTMLLPPFHMRVGDLLHERGMAVTFHLRLRTLHFASRGLGSLGRGRSLSVTRP